MPFLNGWVSLPPQQEMKLRLLLPHNWRYRSEYCRLIKAFKASWQSIEACRAKDEHSRLTSEINEIDKRIKELERKIQGGT